MSDGEFLNTLCRSLDGVHVDVTLDSLPQPLRVLWLLQDLDTEVSIGGLLAYLTNSSGRHALAAVDALQQIGAPQAAAILDRSIALIGPELCLVKEATARHEVLQPYAAMPDAQAISSLGDDLVEVLYGHEDFSSRLTSYLREHVDEVAAFCLGSKEL